MKTFKMLEFEYIADTERQPIPLIDGILINQENSHKSWILELYITTTYRPLFEELLEKNTVFEAQVVISFPDNDPARFTLVVSKIQDIHGKVSVLCRGTLKAQRKRYAEGLLQQLLAEGVSNEELLARFAQGMRERPALKKQK